MEYELPKDIWDRKKLGLELRQKYELYFVSVAFTLAGLSVQTATRSGPFWRIPIEISGWLLLLVAALLGLWRISKLWQYEVWISDYQESEFVTPNKALKAVLDKLGTRLHSFGRFQYCVFLIGIVFIAISRAVALLCP